MFKPPELYIGLRYTRSQRKTQFISFISFASLVGIMLGVITLITILSIMNGFEKELRSRILGMVSHITVSNKEKALTDWPKHYNHFKQQTHIMGVAPYIEKQVMVSSSSGVHGVLIQGIDPHYQPSVSNINQHLIDGSFDQLKSRHYTIAIGVELASTLNVVLGDKITVISPHAQVTPAGLIPRTKRFTIGAIYQVGLPEFDGASAFIHIDDAGRLFKMKNQASGIRLKIDQLFQAPQIANTMQKEQTVGYLIKDWTVDNGSLYQAARTEKIMMFMLLALIIGIAVTNLISSLEMMVNDKRADIAILRTMGMTPQQIMKIFMFQGTIIGATGTLLGVILGVLLAINVENMIPAIENLIGFKLFPPDLFYISEIPSDLHVQDVIMVTIVSLIISLIAVRGPAKRASKIQPAEALRYD